MRLMTIIIAVFLFSCNSSGKKIAVAEKTIPVDSHSNAQKDTVMDFRGGGNEPFWSIEVGFEKSMHFKTIAGLDITASTGKGNKAMDANVTRYSGESEKGSLIVQIAQWECTDDMSGQKFDFTVMVDIKEKGKANYVSYKGCGRFLNAAAKALHTGADRSKKP